MPEELKPRRIEIASSGGPKPVGHDNVHQIDHGRGSVSRGGGLKVSSPAGFAAPREARCLSTEEEESMAENLIPWGRSRSSVPSMTPSDEASPFVALHREMNRLFDDVFNRFDAGVPSLLGRTPGWLGGSRPVFEVNASDNGIRVSAELPGMDEEGRRSPRRQRRPHHPRREEIRERERPWPLAAVARSPRSRSDA